MLHMEKDIQVHK